MEKEVLEALEEIAGGDPEVLEQIIEIARAAEGRAEELEVDLAAKSARAFSRQLKDVAGKLEGRAADRLSRLADDVADSEKAEWPELAGRVRKIAESVSDEKLKARLERIAAKMEEEALGSYGYAYPEPKKSADDDLRDQVGQLQSRLDEVAKSLSELSEQLGQSISALASQVEEVRAKSAAAIPSVTAERPVSAPVSPVADLLKQIIPQ